MIRRVWNAVFQDLKLISPALVLVCCLYVAIGATLFILIGDQQNKYGGLVSNIFAGSLDTLVAVVLINFLITRSARRELYSLRFAAYAQLEGALRVFELTWAGMLIASSKNAIQIGANLVTDTTVMNVAEHLDLDAHSGLMETTWFARAGAGGQILRNSLNEVISRQARALAPLIILKCMALEKSLFVVALADLALASAPFLAKGITMGKPFMLKFAAKELGPLEEFLAMIQSMAKEFELEPGFKSPVSFKMRQELIDHVELGSAYVD